MTVCNSCKQEQDMILPSFGICLNCAAGVPEEDKSMMFRAVSLKMLKDAIERSPPHPQQDYVKVQFFEDAILMTVRDQMNKFFEQEKISKDRIVEIKYIKDRDRYSVMVVYV